MRASPAREGASVPTAGARWPYARPRPQISVTEGVTLATTLVWPTFILFMPAVLGGMAREDAWWVAVAGGTVMVPIAVLLAALAGRMPHLGLVDQAQVACGKWLGKVVGAFFTAGVTCLGVYAVRSGIDMIGLLMLPRTPPWVISLLMVGQAAVGAYYGLEVVSRAAVVAFLGVGAVLVFLLPGLLSSFDIRLLFPALSYGIKPLLLPLYVAGGFWAQLAALAACGQAFRRPAYLREALLGGGAVAVLAGGLLMVFTQGTTGWYAVSRHTLPIVELIRSIRMFVPLLERVDVVVVIGWTLMGFCQVAWLLWAASWGWTRVFGLVDFRPLLPVVTVVVAVLALTFPRNEMVLIDVWSGSLVPAVGWGMWALAGFIWVVAALRRLGGGGSP